ncbi:SNF2-related protein [uncultured Oscillibacter sp.]|uniref:SNF2-related protein n=1 Tax=uncultured Oscillibacter sp. TaxID=876091 RepID=UPI00260A2570|nr:SNF2-related protein [uncultured Oscillibacter sp.]
MVRTLFHAYYQARQLEQLSQEQFVPVFASSDIQIYPFQIAAASFALRSPYQKGAVLCDEAGMGKSHEAMLVINQKWLEGCSRILLVIPNVDLLQQWTEMLERFYTVPYVVLTNREQWRQNTSPDTPNAFIQDALVITTYDFAADNEDAAKVVNWDLAVFEEANALTGVYQEGNKQAKALKRIAGESFKLLLTGTPIEKNIMDLYGLIWFIDETLLPGEKEFLARYLRRPENYPELSSQVSRYCFRTLRSQAKRYAKVPERVLMTVEYTPSSQERKLYELLNAYINYREKKAFPEMDPYDLALRLLGLLGSSTAAILQTIKGVIKRLEQMENTQEELAQWQEIQAVAESITQDAKATELLTVLKQGFALMKKVSAKRKAVIFTESVETQKMLQRLLSQEYTTLSYNGSTDYSVIHRFKEEGEVLISTDNGAKGFNLEDSAFVIHYDLLYNTLKMEQRIDRCHRLGQQCDVLSVAFIDKNNFADVRKLELVNKRMLVTNGVFGITDDVLGGFTDDVKGAFPVIAQRLRSKAQVEQDFQCTLDTYEEDNRHTVAAAEDVLFTTFTKELADKVKLSPQYIDRKAQELNNALWEVAKWFFERYNEKNTDCRFVIDESRRIITATNYDQLPVLFYYWTGSRNRPYRSQKVYGMSKDFKPKAGQITLSSIIGRGILHELECSDTGSLTVPDIEEPCEIGLYSVTLTSASSRTERSVLCGRTESGNVLDEDACKEILSLPVQDYIQEGHSAPHWLKHSNRPHGLDELVPTKKLLVAEMEKLSPAQADEMERMKQQVSADKAALSRELNALDSQVQQAQAELEAVTGDRLQRLALQKKVTKLRQEYMKRQENQFFDAMRLDMELEEKIKAFAEKEKLTERVQREFVVRVRCSNV